jgi:hypothetical protein
VRLPHAHFAALGDFGLVDYGIPGIASRVVKNISHGLSPLARPVADDEVAPAFLSGEIGSRC